MLWRTLGCLIAVAVALTVALSGASAAGCGAPCAPGDYDGDQIKDWADNCQFNANPRQTDTDGDTEAPVLDAGKAPDPVAYYTGPLRIYPATPYQSGQPVPTESTDRDPLTGGDPCDRDDDNDGIRDRRTPGEKGPDNCRLKPNPNQEDADGDGEGDVCDAVFDAAELPPVAAITVARLRTLRYEEATIGIPVKVQCSAGCSLRADLTLDARSARAIKIAAPGGTAVLGRGTARLDAAGATFLIVRVPAKSLRNLSKRLPSVRPMLQVTAVGADKPAAGFRVKLRR